MAGYTAAQLGITAPSGGFKDNGWYQARNYDAATQTFGEPNQAWSGNSSAAKGSQISNEVVAQTNPNNVTYVQQQQQLSASQIKAPVNVPYTSGATTNYLGSIQGTVDSAKTDLQNEVTNQQDQNTAALTAARGAVQGTLNNIQEVTTPFRQTAEQQGQQQFGTNDVLSSQKALVGELGDLLSQGNELVKQQQNVTGLSAIRNPRVQQTMSDITARVGVIQAVMSAQNGYLSNAYTAIDRSVNAIAADRQDQLTYYQTVLQLQNQDVVSLTQEDQKLAEEKVAILQGNLDEANKTADYVKQLMVDPATAQMMGQAGVTLNDSVDVINQKLAQAQYAKEVATESNNITEKGGVPIVDPSSVPSDRLVSFTDSQGNVHYYEMPASSTNATSSLKATKDKLLSDVLNKATIDQVMKTYGNSLSPDTILQVYNDNSPWGQAKESATTLAKKYNVSLPSSTSKLSASDQANVKQIKDDISKGSYTRDEAIQAYPEYASYL